MYIARILEGQIKRSLRNNKVLFLLGARQVGKTTLINYLFGEKAAGFLNLDVDMDRTRLLYAAKLEPKEAMQRLGAKKVLIVDEAQRLNDIGRICKGWYDSQVPVKIILLGSASYTLLDHAASELVGRNEKLWLTPMLFSEVLGQQRWFNENMSSGEVHSYFEEQLNTIVLYRLVFGSYPEAYLIDDPKTYLENLVSDYLLKDIFTASLVRSPADVRCLLRELAMEIGNTLSVLQLATRLSLSRQTVQRYLDLLEKIFVIFKVSSYCTDVETEVSRSNKYYFWDTGVRNALLREWSVSMNRSDIDLLWENWMMAEIFKQSWTYLQQKDLLFWRSRNGSNVNLIVKRGSDLHAFNMLLSGNRKRNFMPSFERRYEVPIEEIHLGNFLDYVL